MALGDSGSLDLKRPFNLDKADRILVSYALSMIPDWHATVDRALDHLAPSGELHIVDFGPMRRMPSLFRRAMRLWLSKFGVMPRDELETVARALAEARGMSVEFKESTTGYWVTVIVRAP